VGFRRRRWRDVRPDEDKVRINNAIRVPQVRVVNEDGQQLGVMATEAARDIASRVGLDLVEIAAAAQPPVCKIMDYGRFKYELKKKAASAKKTQHQSQVKEVKLRPRIADHDLDFKMGSARRFLFEGDKVKCTVMFRGREMQHQHLGHELLQRVIQMLSAIASVESRPQREGRTLYLTLAPNRGAIDKLKAAMAAAAPDDERDEDESGEADVDERAAEEEELSLDGDAQNGAESAESGPEVEREPAEG
jgi:translation initiation factor IF-3